MYRRVARHLSIFVSVLMLTGVASAAGVESLIRAHTAVPAPSVGDSILGPAASYGRLIWLQRGTYPAGNAEIRVKDLASGETTTIASIPLAEGDLGLPSIHYNKAVYSKRVGGDTSSTAGWDVFVYNFDTKTEARVTNAAGDQIRPDVYGDWIVYQDNRHGDSDIYLYDMREQRESRLTSSTAEQRRPSVGYDRVAYEDDRNGNWDIYTTNLYDFSTQRITSNSHDQRHPSLGDGCIAYEDHRNGNWDIYLSDLWGAKTVKRLSSSRANQANPDVSGRRIVWSDPDGNGSASAARDDIVMYEMRFGTTHRLTNDTARQSAMDIAGGQISFLQNGSIHLASLRYPRLSVKAPATVAYRGRATISGRLSTNTGIAIPGRVIQIHRSTDQTNWTYVTSVKTRSDGTYHYTGEELTSRRYYRVTYKGDNTYLSSRNWSAAVKPKVYLTRPSGPSATSSSFWAIGYLLPHHRLGGHSVALVCYRKEAGVWTYKRTLWATDQDFRGYTRYRVLVGLPEKGAWRIRARHEDLLHARTYSAWRYLSVK